MASYFLAPSLVALRNEVNARWPDRLKTSDGWIGDTSHAARKSDHNPDWDNDGIVRALDIDEDLDGNAADGTWDARPIVDTILARRDPRIAYVIYEGLIWRSYAKPGLAAWAPANYTGINSHGHHVHVSIHHTHAAENDTSPWLTAIPPAPVSHQEDPDMLIVRRENGAAFLLSGITLAGIKTSADVAGLKAAGIKEAPISERTWASFSAAFTVEHG